MSEKTSKWRVILGAADQTTVPHAFAAENKTHAHSDFNRLAAELRLAQNAVVRAQATLVQAQEAEREALEAWRLASAELTRDRPE